MEGHRANWSNAPDMASCVCDHVKIDPVTERNKGSFWDRNGRDLAKIVFPKTQRHVVMPQPHGLTTGRSPVMAWRREEIVAARC